MANEIIERATKAIAADFRRQEPLHGGTYWFDDDNVRDAIIDGRFDLEALARAVLQAICEPSETQP